MIIAAERSYARRLAYFGVFLLAFFITFSLLLAADLVPNAVSLHPDEEATLIAGVRGAFTIEPKKEEMGGLSASPLIEPESPRPLLSADVSDASVLSRRKGEQPVSIEIPRVGIKATVDNPTSTDVAVLDEALLTGVVRYPTSAKLGTTGNVVIFGHSSYLPVVHNKAFKAFNGIQNLKKGDEIVVYSETKAYIYAVEEVGEADASADAIPLSVSGEKLTLSTCDSFGAKTDRFIVIADLVETRSI
jgi:LPXTG-site transpeptidase (sortase) family protein